MLAATQQNPNNHRQPGELPIANCPIAREVEVVPRHQQLFSRIALKSAIGNMQWLDDIR